ncbi:MAG: 4Fe-4S cluster-binding domain-containing protein [Oscillospiraceae bacterium]|nr:4Fe-4S cluster-binding domain-containing protein [Oscillospiraceae bacterium]
MAGSYRKYCAEASLDLMILPTYNCNFRCPYCFERHRLSRGQEWLCKTMSEEMVDAIFKAVEKEKARGVKAGSCTLYGGEPFLEKTGSLCTALHGRPLLRE